jgi:hypothetical protein
MTDSVDLLSTYVEIELRHDKMQRRNVLSSTVANAPRVTINLHRLIVAFAKRRPKFSMLLLCGLSIGTNWTSQAKIPSL